MLNVHAGGTLHQDIYGVYQDAPKMRTVLCGLERCRVNVLHHQSVDRLGHGIVIVAYDHAGIVQAIEGQGERFVVGVQWHPEFLMLDPCQQGLFRSLVAAARERRLSAAA